MTLLRYKKPFSLIEEVLTKNDAVTSFGVFFVIFSFCAMLGAMETQLELERS